MRAGGHSLVALLAVAVMAAGATVAPQANAVHPRSAAAVAMPPEFSGTVAIEWNMTAVTDDGYLVTTRHSDGHVILEAAKGDTLSFPPILWFRVRELAGVETRTVVSPEGPVWDDCDQTVHYSVPVSSDIPVDMAGSMRWTTPDDASPWGVWGFYLPEVFANTAFSDPDCGLTRGHDLFRLLEMAGIPAFDYPPILVAHNTDSAGGRMHVVGSEHYDLMTPWVAKWNSQQDPAYPNGYYTAYDVTVSFDLRRIAPGSKFAQYPTIKLTNDAQGRDVIRLQTRQPVPRASFQVTTRKAGSSLIYNVGSWRADARGRKKLVLLDPKLSKATCYQIQISHNKVTLPGQTLVKCVK